MRQIARNGRLNIEGATTNRIVWTDIPAADAPSPATPHPSLRTNLGTLYHGDSRSLMRSVLTEQSVDLILTSPPFPLIRKKDYGNEDADRYVAWFEDFAEGFKRVIKPRGSVVIDLGSAWKPGKPVKSLYQYELVVMLAKKFGFQLCQEFFWWNPARLPSPIEWVNIRRVRFKDAVNLIWWMSLSPYPRVSNRRVLQPYSDSMKELLRANVYNRGPRPSGHVVGENFGVNNGGAIPPNLIALANTENSNSYLRYCDEHKLPQHPARFPAGIPSFFLRMLTNKGDLVLDPFSGSAVTGEVSEQMGRRWVCCDSEASYVAGSVGRFTEISEKARGRVEPYLAHPPANGPLDEETMPLIEDGGERRRDKPERPGDS